MLLSGDTLFCVIIYFGDKYLQIKSGRNQRRNQLLHNGSFVSKRGSVISGFHPHSNLSQSCVRSLNTNVSRKHVSSELEEIEESTRNQEREIHFAFVNSAESRNAKVINEAED
jgi:hypothetical protein